MSIFSSIKKSRQSAKSHNAKLAEQKKMEESATPYRHVPTHAASDAIASAPPSWREADKVRVVEQNRRRSAMAASGHHMNMPGTPRVGSSLSYVAYAADGTAGSMVPPLPRAYSHTGVPNLQQQAMYGVPQMAYSQPFSLKGKEVTRWPIYETPDQDPGYGKDAQSVAESSSGSSSSRDNLETKSAQPNTNAIGVAETRWHQSSTRPRRKSDPLTDPNLSIKLSKSSHAVSGVRDPRPPPSTRGFSAIPPSAVPPPLLGSKLPGHLLASGVPTSAQTPVASFMTAGPATSPVSSSTTDDLAVQPPSLKPSRASSAVSLPGLAPTSSRLLHSVPGTPGASLTASFEFPFPGAVSPTSESSHGNEHGGAVQPSSSPSSPAKPKERRPSRPTRFTELERIESAPDVSHHNLPSMSTQEGLSSLSHVQEVDKLPEAAMAVPEVVDERKGRGKKLRKGGNKLVKKPRGAAQPL